MAARKNGSRRPLFERAERRDARREDRKIPGAYGGIEISIPWPPTCVAEGALTRYGKYAVAECVEAFLRDYPLPPRKAIRMRDGGPAAGYLMTEDQIPGIEQMLDSWAEGRAWERLSLGEPEDAHLPAVTEEAIERLRKHYRQVARNRLRAGAVRTFRPA